MTEVEVLQGGVLKVGDTKPALRLRLLDENGDPANLNGFNATIVVKKSNASSPKVNASATVSDADRGIVEYSWQSNDTDTEGIFQAEVTTDDGTHTISYPNDHYFRVHVMENLT